MGAHTSSSILTVGRGILACLQPLTGARATGTAVFKPVSGSSEFLPPYVYLSPIVNGAYRPELSYKVPFNPGDPANGQWPILAAGTAVPIMSNLGGKRYNLPAGTVFRIEPDAGGNVQGSCVTTAALTGGTDLADTGDLEDQDLAINTAVLYETMGVNASTEMFNANIGGKFPAVLLFWAGDEPADGYASNNTQNPAKRGSHAMQYAQDFELWLVCSRQDTEAQRRGQAMRMLDAIAFALYDRMSVDGLVISSPGGLHIKRRSRESGNGEDFFKAYRVYSMTISATITIVKPDLYTPANLVRFKSDYLKQDVKDDGTSDDLPLLHGILINNPQT